MVGRWILDDDQSLYFVADANQDEPDHSSVEELCVDHWPSSVAGPDLEQSESTSWLSSDLLVDSSHNFENSLLSEPDIFGLNNFFDVSTDTGNTVVQRAARENPRKRPFDQTAESLDNEAFNRAFNSTLLSSKRINLDYMNFLSQSPSRNLTMGYNTSLPRSRFDAYIHVLRQLIRCANEKSDLVGNLKQAITAEGVLWVVREAWPAAEGYWNLTATFRGFLHAELWRNFPCERTYRQLPPEYRPTRAQLMIPHSPMIDWMPWPDVRDLAIRFQDVIDTDELFRMAILNVVAHRKKVRRASLASSNFSTAGEESDERSVRVWDLTCLEKSNGTNPLADPGLCRKPLLRSPGARALVRMFDLEYDQFSTQKLDNSFFEAFPNLYCETASSVWQVEQLTNVTQEDVGYPIDLSRSAIVRLKSKLERLIGASIEV